MPRLRPRRPNDERFYDADENVDQAAVGCWMMLDFFRSPEVRIKGDRISGLYTTYPQEKTHDFK